jgi:hypothetical protein
MLACGPAQQPAAQQPAQPAAPQQAAPKPAAEPAKPAAEPAKPAAQPAKPAAEPAKPAASGAKTRILYGSSSPPSSYYIHSVAVAKLWNAKVPEVEVTNVEAGGCLDHIRRMDRGEFQAGVACPDLTYRAWNGLEEFKDKPLQTQRFLYIHSVAPQGWVVRKDTNIEKIEDLTGKDFTPGMKGSATERQTINVMEVIGVKPKYYSAGIQDMIQAYKDRRIVGFVKLHAGAKAIDAAIQEANITLPLRELSFTPEQEKKVLEKYPYYTFMDVEKDQLAPGYPDRKVRTVALPVGVSIHKDIPEDLAYRLTKISIEDNTEKGEQAQATAYPAVKGADFVPLTLQYVMTPLHAGAVKYFRELGKQVKPEQIPPEMK